MLLKINKERGFWKGKKTCKYTQTEGTSTTKNHHHMNNNISDQTPQQVKSAYISSKLTWRWRTSLSSSRCSSRTWTSCCRSTHIGSREVIFSAWCRRIGWRSTHRTVTSITTSIAYNQNHLVKQWERLKFFQKTDFSLHIFKWPKIINSSNRLPTLFAK